MLDQRVADDVDLDSPRGRALLVRELAYMIQLDQGAGWRCGSALTRNALRVQRRYLASFLETKIPLDAEELLRLSPCRL